MYSEAEARERGMALRNATEGEPCEVDISEDEVGLSPEGEEWSLFLLTPTYELTPGIMQALYREGPYGLRHLGPVRDNDARHVWLLKEQDE